MESLSNLKFIPNESFIDTQAEVTTVNAGQPGETQDSQGVSYGDMLAALNMDSQYLDLALIAGINIPEESVVQLW